jgi:hypothetical protein
MAEPKRVQPFSFYPKAEPIAIALAFLLALSM